MLFNIELSKILYLHNMMSGFGSGGLNKLLVGLWSGGLKYSNGIRASGRIGPSFLGLG